MSKIHYSNISSKAPLNTNKITNELIEILYELLPNKFSHWSLKFAQSKSNHRQIHDASIWLDKLQVYVGLPDWVLTEEQMLSEQLPYLKCPFGLLESLSDATESNLNLALPVNKHCSLSERDYDALFHTSCFDVEFQAAKLDSDIINNTGDFEFVPDQSERLITFEHEHVREKSEYLVKRIKREQAYEENMNVLRTAIATCKQLVDGDQQLIKAFLD